MKHPVRGYVLGDVSEKPQIPESADIAPKIDKGMIVIIVAVNFYRATLTLEIGTRLEQDEFSSSMSMFGKS